MKCPKCGSDKVRVVDTRSYETVIRRRRQCQCGYCWDTEETIIAVTVSYEDYKKIPSKLALL